MGETTSKLFIHDNKHIFSYTYEVDSHITTTSLDHIGLYATRHTQEEL